jgi:hypothetical protein
MKRVPRRLGAILTVCLPAFSSSFHSSNGQTCRMTCATRRHLLPIIDPTMAMDMGIAVASAAAGAVSQFPRIQQLERELTVAKDALTDSEQQLVQKITELEERLFQMDQEFEEQTDRFKKKYDTRMRGELEKVKDKIITDYKYKLEIKLEEQKANMLGEKLEFVNTLTSGKTEQLVNLRIEKENINRANEKLEEALALSQSELDRMRSEASLKKGWWPFS